MGSLTNLPFFFGLYFYARLVDTTVLVRAPSPILVTMGKEPLTLECSYRTSESEMVIGLNWYHKASKGDNFEMIAQVPYQKDLQPAFTDQSLESRGKINTTSTGMFSTVRLEIDHVKCTDVGEYECEVRVYRDKTLHKAKVHVYLNEEPAAPVLSYDRSTLIENNPLTFTCTASMGRPVGTFRWMLYNSGHRGPLEEVELPGSTSISKPVGRCSPTGTSTLAIVVTRDDRKVKCVVEQQSEEGVIQVWDESQLHVKYRVTDVEIYTHVGKTDLPSSNVAVEEGEHVHLMCRARGNPMPEFHWNYLPLGGHTGLLRILTHPELTTKNITANQSGSYVCVASNHISGEDYSKSRSVRIIVKDEILSKQRMVKGTDYVADRYLLIGGIFTGALLLTVLFSLLSVKCARRCSQKSLSPLPSTQALTNHTYAQIETFDVRISQS